MNSGLGFAQVSADGFGVGPTRLSETAGSMQDDRKAQSVNQPDGEPEETRDVVALPALPSFSFGDAKNILEIEVQADQLLSYINKLTSLTDRACSSAIQQSETTRRVEENRHSEAVYLRRQLDQANAQLRDQQRALARLEQSSRTQVSALESQLHRQQIARLEREIEALRSRSERDTVPQPSKKTEEPTHAAVQQEVAPLTQELAQLKQQLAARDETIEAKNRMMKSIELDFHAKTVELEQRLRDAQQELQKQEANLKEKDALLQATAAKEVEMGNLIKRLSSECEQLNRELQEKSQALAGGGPKKAPPASETKTWRRVIGRLQEDL